MNLNDPLGMLIFFAIFEIPGGAAVGAAVRGFLHRDFSGFFFLIWGSGFGGIPMLIGAVSFLTAHQPAYFFAQLFLFFAPLLAVALVPRDLFQGSSVQVQAESNTAFVSVGFIIVGGAIVLLTLRSGISIPLLIGSVLAFIGIAILFGTAIRVVRTL